ncbi:MAG: VWA domain-containing protein [Pyrinomonadaceae bacterium]|nr:VWA domain-containing protein [Pyrinomonadaceae bacterium]MBP9109063.1 VWA domain-containing protein [Pyrinomonadaceae bacterium]
MVKVSQLLIGLLVCLTIHLQAQDDVVKIDTELVSVPATVLDRNGKFVGGLERSNFSIFENGIQQEIVLFNAVDEPFTVMMVLDTSGSMKSFMPLLADAASEFVRQLRPNDKVFAVKFSDQIESIFPVTRVADLKPSFKLIPKSREGETIIYDAVDHALKKMRSIKGRKAIILFSDGVGVGIASAKGTLRDAEEQEALIYTIQFGSFPEKPSGGVSQKVYKQRIDEINSYMRDLALKTGGKPFHIDKIENLSETFRQVAQELGQQYTLGYYPEKSGKGGERRKITVKVDIPNVAVRSRNEVVFRKSGK